MSHTALIKFAPVFTCERFNDPAWTRPGRTMYYPGALKFLPGRTSVPLLADHDEDHEVGTVDKLFQMDWTDGPWICASATVPDDAVSWLKRGAGASFGSRPFDRREVSIRGTTADVIRHAFVDEVSVLIAKKPNEPRAAVLSVQREEPPAARAACPVAGEVHVDDIEARIKAANRSPLDKLYDEVMAAKRTEPRVLVRHGVGQVLGVR